MLTEYIEKTYIFDEMNVIDQNQANVKINKKIWLPTEKY